MHQPNRGSVCPGHDKAHSLHLEAQKPEKRIKGLDLLRGVASLMVCWFHLTFFVFESPSGSFYNFLKSSAAYGWLGVHIFFVISGFVIPYSLHRARYQIRDYPTFILKRLTRLDPPYLVTIAGMLLFTYLYTRYSGTPFLVEGAPVTWTRVLLHIGYLNSFFRQRWLTPVFWTLAIEFQYYILMGLIFPLVSSANRKLRITAVICFGAICLLSTDWAVPGEIPSSRFIVKYTFLFLMGILTFQYLTGISKKGEYLALLLLATCGCYVTLGLPALLAGTITVAVTIFYDRKSRGADFFGKISYSLYLLHWIVGPFAISLVANRLIDTTGDVGKTVVLLCGLAASIGAAYLLYVLVEKPAQQLSARFKYKKVEEKG